jgi:outer membrane lipoprotein-sorting protein
MVLAAALALSAALPALAQETAPLPRERPAMGQFSQEQLNALNTANQVFNSIRTMRGEFLQIGPTSDQLTEGVFYIARPGRVRFEYYPPSQLLIVSNGNTLEIRNNATSTVDRYPLQRTPLAPLLATNTDLTAEANIRDVMIEDDTVAIVLTRSEDGSWLTLYFDKVTYELRQWVTLDAQGNTITFVIYNLAVNQPIDDALFEVVLPGDAAEPPR